MVKDNELESLKARWKAGENLEDLADEFGLSQADIYNFLAIINEEVESRLDAVERHDG